MQYASGSRDHGLGRGSRPAARRRSAPTASIGIERTVVPTIQRLLAFFRQHRLKLVYLTVGSELPDYSDLLPHMRAFAESAGNTRGNHEHEILDALAPRAGEAVLNKTTMSAFHSTGFERLVRAWGSSSWSSPGSRPTRASRAPPATPRTAASAVLLVEDGCGAASQALRRRHLHELRPPPRPGGLERAGPGRAGERPACLTGSRRVGHIA